MVGGQVEREATALDPHSQQRPDLRIVFPGRTLLSDVVVTHALSTSRVARSVSVGTQSAAAAKQWVKKMYAHVASRLGAELLNVSVDTCGGLASEAVQLVRTIGEEGERWTAGTWTRARIERQLLGRSQWQYSGATR